MNLFKLLFRQGLYRFFLFHFRHLFAKKSELRWQKFNPEKWCYNKKCTLLKVKRGNWPCIGLGRQKVQQMSHPRSYSARTNSSLKLKKNTFQRKDDHFHRRMIIFIDGLSFSSTDDHFHRQLIISVNG